LGALSDVLRIVGGLACVVFMGQADAGVGTSTLTAQTSVNTNCTVSTAGVVFGSYNPIGTNLTNDLNASGSITIACVKDTAPTIALGLGNNASGITRRMFDASASDYLIYELYQPPNNTPGTACSYPGSTVWGTSGTNLFTATSALSKSARTYNICGTVPKAQNPSIGSSYADTVVATVNF
jgi:spore coat protein U domain-containing protein, fimbrial subunit CupE1/2/3/6